MLSCGQIKHLAEANTIADLIDLLGPTKQQLNAHASFSIPARTNTYSLTPTLLRWHRESDEDFHLVLSDAAGHTLIPDTPAPDCVPDTHFAKALTQMRARLQNLKFYGSTPQFICCSATIANPGELASQLFESEVTVVDENGAPAGEKVFIFYNPPMVNRDLGIRRSYINEATRVAKELLARKLQTIVFANSRLHTEVMLTYLLQANSPKPGQPELVRGYRGGYLPGERREIERGLRDGQIRGVVATNALEFWIARCLRDGGICWLDCLHLAACRTGGTAQRHRMRGVCRIFYAA